MKTINGLLIGTMSALLVACGGGGGGSSTPAATTPPAPVQQNAAGIWNQTYVVSSGVNTGDTIKSVMLVSPSSSFFTAGVNQQNGCAGIGFGQAAISGTSFTATEQAAVITFTNIPGINVNCSYSDGSTTATVSVTGTVTTGESLVATGTGTTSFGTSLGSSTDTFTYSTLNSIPPSLATVAGSYTTADGSTLTIDSAGNISELNNTTGCTYSGTISIPSSSYNIYNVTVAVSACNSTYASSDGLIYSGLAAYNDTVSPNELMFGVSTSSGGTFYAIAAAIQK